MWSEWLRRRVGGLAWSEGLRKSVGVDREPHEVGGHGQSGSGGR